ncbi:energy transducer TonB [Altererythrobacter sp. MF3-039]|uniref:energy transducer TonB n=1 Tax=Altererythrobacter sp. MF3-039 TaxID=3252901 RepID=UPI00390C8B8C
MAYVDTAGSRNRSGPIAAVIAIHAGLGFVLVSGLSTAIITTIEEDFGAVEFPVAPPPDVDDPPPQPENSAVKQSFTAPEPMFELNREPSMEVEPAVLPDFDDVIRVPIDLPKVDFTPTVSFDPIPPRPRNSPANWVTTRDYPSSPLRRGEEGITRFRLSVSANGTIESCTVTRSSGVTLLDQATCRYVSKRAKFHPGRDSSDKPVAGHYDSSVSWVIPD